uniref:Alanine-rich protein n=1 Tax=Streptomyces sp. NBC_00003 TaxID=2903608 RepID=A0AAU2VBQ8_9ACTN
MKASAFLYPWDVLGDPDAPARIADLGVGQVTLASAYHSTRALTPRHPRHRIVTAEHAAVLYPPDELAWKGRGLRPYPAGSWAPGDAYGEAAEALAAAGLDVHSWVVLAHNSRLGTEHPTISVVNAYGDRYPWAPCIAQPRVREYLVALAAEAAVRPGASGTELESCGWYGLAHLHAHDKIAGASLDDTAQYLMSLCFCASCERGYAEVGLDAGELRVRVRGVLESVWRGGPVGASGGELRAATLEFRARVATELQEEAVAAVRARARPGFQVLLHADPRRDRCGANVGVDPGHVLGVADGVVVPCAGGPELLAPFAGRGVSGAVLAANFTVVSGMGGRPGALAEDAARAAALGATELRLYHAGLASEGDLDAVRGSGVLG